MVADVISGVVQMEKDQALKSCTVEELKRELARREKVIDHQEGGGILQDRE